MSWINTGVNYCNRIRDYLDSYLNSELLVETNHEVLRHLEECQACAEVLQTRMRVKARLKEAVLRQEVPIALELRIRKALRRSSPDMRPWTLAAAAALVVAIGIWGTVWFRNKPAAGESAGLVAPPASSLSGLSGADASILEIGFGQHVHCALDAGFANKEFSEEAMSENLGPKYAGLVSLVRHRVPSNIVVVVAHRCQYKDRQFVHLILRDRQTVLSVVITRKDGESFPPGARGLAPESSGLPLHHASLRSLQVTGFETTNFLVFVVSNLSDDDNIRIASSLAPAMRDFLSRLEA